MLTRDILSGEHRELTEQAAALARLLAAFTPDIAAIGQVRWRMSRVLLEHLAKEDKLLYPRLAASADMATRDIARRFQRDMGSLSQAYRAHLARWPASAIEADWDGYRRDTHGIIAALSERIQREESELYPRVAA